MSKKSTKERSLSALDWVLMSAAPVSIAIGGGSANAFTLKAAESAALLSFAAGLTTMPFAHEVAPHILEASGFAAKLAAVVGLTIGLVLMMTSSALEAKSEAPDARPPVALQKIQQGTPPALLQLQDLNTPDSPYPVTAVLASGLDIFIDGLLTGSTVGAGKGSVPLAGALALENGSIAMAVTEHLKGRHSSEAAKLSTTAGLAMSSALGNWLGYLGGKRFQEGNTAFVGLMGFAAIIILWLVTQELLPEAAKVPGSKLTNAGAYFGGIGSAIALEWIGG